MTEIGGNPPVVRSNVRGNVNVEGRVAQLVRASALQAEGHRFESCRVHHLDQAGCRTIGARFLFADLTRTRSAIASAARFAIVRCVKNGNKSLFAFAGDKLLLLGLAVVIVAPVGVYLYLRAEVPTICYSREDLERTPDDAELVVTSGLDDDDVKGLARFDSLRELELHYSEISDTGVDEIVRHESLTRLVLHGIELTDSGVSKLGALTQLNELLLVGCVDVTDAGLVFLAGLSGLETLMLHRFSGVTDALCETLAQCTGLKSLSLDFCYRIGDDGIAKLGALEGLTELSIHGLDSLTDESLSHLAKLNNLTKLELPLQAALSDKAIATLRAELPNCEINR